MKKNGKKSKKYNICKVFKMLVIFFIFYIIYIKNYFKIKILKYTDDFNEMEKFTKKNLDGYVEFSKLKYLKISTPKISVVITVFNGEGYIKPVLRSIQNQDFLDLEIIIVDDCSKDNSIAKIKELMEEDRRIKLLRNEENRGTLYTKTRGVLSSSGKYVVTLDHDNLYSNKYTFSILYEEAEKNNLDLLGFSSIVTSIDMKNLKKEQYLNYIETSIINKPLIKTRFLSFKGGESSTSLCLYLIKTELFRNIIQKLGTEIINRNIDSHDDTIMMFLLSRYANNLKHIKRILHLVFAWPTSNNQPLIFQNNIKLENREKKKCISFLTLIEVLFLFTENNAEDKKIASHYLIHLFLNQDKCKKEPGLIKEATKICQLFLKNEFIEMKVKNMTNEYLNEINKNNKLL